MKLPNSTCMSKNKQTLTIHSSEDTTSSSSGIFAYICGETTPGACTSICYSKNLKATLLATTQANIGVTSYHRCKSLAHIVVPCITFIAANPELRVGIGNHVASRARLLLFFIFNSCSVNWVLHFQTLSTYIYAFNFVLLASVTAIKGQFSQTNKILQRSCLFLNQMGFCIEDIVVQIRGTLFRKQQI